VGVAEGALHVRLDAVDISLIHGGAPSRDKSART
jgi:hypothetical protein